MRDRLIAALRWRIRATMAIPEPPMLTTQLLAAIRAQEYPNIIDDNGQPWYMNAIRRLETSRLAPPPRSRG